MIDRLREDCPVALAVSLHAPDDALRDELVPLNRKYPIAELLASARRYLERAPRDFITIEYCMLDGVNDSPAQAEALLALLRGDGSAAQPGVAEQGQPDPVQSVRGLGPEALVGRRASPRSRPCCRTAASSPPFARPAATTSPPPAASSPARCRTGRGSPSGARGRRRCAVAAPVSRRADGTAEPGSRA